jgi:hypothetical protein
MTRGSTSSHLPAPSSTTAQFLNASFHKIVGTGLSHRRPGGELAAPHLHDLIIEGHAPEIVVFSLETTGRPLGSTTRGDAGGSAARGHSHQSCYVAVVAHTSVSLATLIALGSAPVLVVTADAVITRSSRCSRPPY